MTVLRIVADLAAQNPAAFPQFHSDLPGLEVVMDHGFITNLAGKATAPLELCLASEGGSGTEVPALSIGGDDLDDVLNRAARPVDAPVAEPWGCAASICATLRER